MNRSYNIEGAEVETSTILEAEAAPQWALFLLDKMVYGVHFFYSTVTINSVFLERSG